MKNMTAKDLHIAVKNQATEEDLMIRYGINSSEELYDLMSKVSPGNLEHFKREIKKNQKSRSRKESRKEAAVLEQQKEDTEQIRVATQEGTRLSRQIRKICLAKIQQMRMEKLVKL